MKLLLFALLLVGGYFLYQYTIGRINNNFRTCYQTAQNDIVSIQSSSSLNACPPIAKAYENMFSCIEDLQSQGNIQSFVYQSSPVRAEVEAAVIEHNVECSGHKVNPPKQKIFVQAISR